MTYPPQPGGYDPYNQQPGYSPHGYDPLPGYGYGYPGVTAPGPRPQVVTIAAMLIVLTVLANVGLGLVAGFGMIAPEEVTGQEVDKGGAITMGIVSILVGLAFIWCALGVLRGRSGARTATFILYGISSCCGGVLTIGAIGVVVEGTKATEGSDIFAIIIGAAFLVYLLVIVLLATPPSNRWFRHTAMARRAGLIA
ncbi:hypothetical protein [Stackebrandtia nassauensis]|uniref:Uncharacterized protein n=1 Tax=Stackebrandtia nassauensis (strain DSM 44728 / CIP 108903 / NRRL B-16338 / NBRC 102104 / LLR-40K-21) TaxID=446470 RepID=D3PUR3_STANL|nr:hypothetical protein [Stackebrandtia nassauensis]ADD44937.1 hypothetical protein Snas_5303 [Stackebrandtia nassauensis DSM 44728]